jgi:enoyl-CoA hydratase
VGGSSSLVEVELRATEGDIGAGAPGSHAVVTLNDPDRRNMLSPQMVDGIVEAFDRLEADESVGAIVVTGAGRAFCAGADLGALETPATPEASATPETPATPEASATPETPEASETVVPIYEGFLRVARCRLPTVAAVNGPAVGAGMNLALSCDVRVVAERGRFECRFSELGLHPGGGHTWLLTRAAGIETATAMVVFGEVVRGTEAVDRRLAWRCVPDGELLEAAGGLAAGAAGVPRELAMRMKQSLQRAVTTDTHEEAVAYELEAQLWSMRQPAFAARLAAVRARVSGAAPRGSRPRGA